MESDTFRNPHAVLLTSMNTYFLVLGAIATISIFRIVYTVGLKGQMFAVTHSMRFFSPCQFRQF